MKRLCSVLLVFAVIASGCSKGTEVEVNSLVQNQPTNKIVEEQNNMPKEMPNDFDFMVRYGYSEVNKNEINTFLDTATKDLILNGTASAEISFTIEEMRSIYEKMREINIMGTKELVPAVVACERVPYSEDSWEVSINGQSKTFTWSEKYCDPTSDAKQLLELRKFIHQIVVGKEAYQKLPEAEGGYE
jgi:hypothetical protein